MKIASSSFNYVSNYKQVQKYERQESISVQKPVQTPQNSTIELPNKPQKTESPMKSELHVLLMILEKIIGEEVEVLSPDFMEKIENETGITFSASSFDMTVNDVNVDFHSSETYYESERFDLNIQGKISLEEGQTLSINFALSMNREFMQHNEIHLRNGRERKDPLVINFDVSHATFNQKTMTFDIDADGQLDEIATLNPGSGFLAIDRNHDNQINDGSELFGPKTNRGFDELRQYDNDSNQWIDENDTIYKDLKIVTFDKEGNQHIHSLKDKSIGAIHLGAMATPFSVKGDNNQDLAQVKQSGIALTESGQAKSIQEIDLFT